MLAARRLASRHTPLFLGEVMLTPRKLKANRRNARKSTGPRTKEGKERSSRNATDHGVYCQDIVLPGESHREFEVMRQGFIKSLLPRNLFELSLVDRIAADQWRLNRLNGGEVHQYEQRRDAHEMALGHILDGRATSDERVNEFFEKLDEQAEGGHDVSKDPAYVTLRSAIGTPSMTLHSMMGDYECIPERYERMRNRLCLSISRALRDLSSLRPKGTELGPSPYCDEQNELIEAIAEAKGIKLPEEEEEEEEIDEESEEKTDGEPSISQNEPTEATPIATTDEAKACSEPTSEIEDKMPV